MGAYVVRRLLHAIPILLGVTLITFLLFYVVSPNPAKLLVSTKGLSQQEAEVKIAEESRRLGTDRPVIEQYGAFLGEILRWDFGESWRLQKGRPVLTMVAEGMGPSLTLAVPRSCSRS